MPGRSIVRVIARVVPASVRDDWRREWDAELAHDYEARVARGERRTLVRARLMARAAASVWDALSLHRYAARTHGSLAQDFRGALRQCRRRPAFAAAVISVLGLGIAAATSIFSVVDAVVLRPPPYRDAERLVIVRGVSARSGSPMPDVLDDFAQRWMRQNQLFEMTSSYRSRTAVLSGAEQPRHVNTAIVGADYLAMLGASFEGGRPFGVTDVRAGVPSVVVLAFETWRRDFGGDPTIIGRTIAIDSQPHVVIGVASWRFVDPISRVALWIPRDDARAPSATSRVVLLAKLRGDVSRASLHERIDGLARQWNRESPRPQGALWNASPSYIADFRADPNATQAAWLLAAGAIGLLLIACANAANLMLINGSVRAGELAVRRALGATRGRVVQQLVIEGAVLGVAAGAVGFGAAVFIVEQVAARLPAELALFVGSGLAVDARLAGFAVAISLAVAIACSNGPALSSTRRDFRARTRHHTPTREQRATRSLIVAFQMAISVVLLAGAGVLVQSLARLTRVDIGVDGRSVLAAEVYLARSRYPDAWQRDRFFDAFVARARALNGVRSVSVAASIPPGTSFHARVHIEGGEGAQPLAEQPALLPDMSVDDAFFSTLGIRLRAGRGFDGRDRRDAPPVAIIDARLAADLWPGASPLGRRFRVDSTSEWLTVVGVASDVRARGPVDRDGHYEIYTAQSQKSDRGNYRTVLIRASGDPTSLVGPVRDIVRSLDPLQPIESLAPVGDRFDHELAQPRFLATVVASFALASLLLSAIGIYGAASYGVAQRTREIGIRLAIGAEAAAIRSAVVRDGLRVAALGAVIGIAATLAFGRWLESQLFGVSAQDPVTLSATAALLLVAAGGAVWSPARRASRVDPMVALRGE